MDRIGKNGGHQLFEIGTLDPPLQGPNIADWIMHSMVSIVSFDLGGLNKLHKITIFCRWTRFLLITCMSMAADAPVWSMKINIET